MKKLILILLTIFLLTCTGPGSKDIEEAKVSYQIVLVDFYGEGCLPCREISPIIDEIEVEYPEVKVIKVDINGEDNLTTKYNVNKIPTVIIYYSGNPYIRFVGFHDKETYTKPIEELLKIKKDPKVP